MNQLVIFYPDIFLNQCWGYEKITVSFGLQLPVTACKLIFVLIYLGQSLIKTR